MRLSGMPKSPYEKGRQQEERLAKSLRGGGAKVKVSGGSRGAADLKAKFPSGTKWNIQVKSATKGTPASPSSKDLGRLKQSSTKTGATPVIAKVTPKGTTYSSAKSGRSLKPPTKK